LSKNAEVLAIKVLVMELLLLWFRFTSAERCKGEKAEVGVRVDEECSVFRQRRDGFQELETKAAHKVPMRRLKRQRRGRK
jgi:hypothetical protein